MKIIFATALIFGVLSCQAQETQKNSKTPKEKTQTENQVKMNENLSIATFGNGCFWCTEAIFLRVRGVEKVVSGYSGGKVANPTYKEVCSGLTGHAEVIQIHFNPSEISYNDLLEVFFHTHDPTTKDRQGNDVGTQYRSAIFFHDAEQKQLAIKKIEDLTKANEFPAPIVTEVVPFEKFYPAEDYHQDYFSLNENANPYCSYVISPKVKKFEKGFKDLLK